MSTGVSIIIVLCEQPHLRSFLDLTTDQKKSLNSNTSHGGESALSAGASRSMPSVCTGRLVNNKKEEDYDFILRLVLTTPPGFLSFQPF